MFDDASIVWVNECHMHKLSVPESFIDEVLFDGLTFANVSMTVNTLKANVTFNTLEDSDPCSLHYDGGRHPGGNGGNRWGVRGHCESCYDSTAYAHCCIGLIPEVVGVILWFLMKIEGLALEFGLRNGFNKRAHGISAGIMHAGVYVVFTIWPQILLFPVESFTWIETEPQFVYITKNLGLFGYDQFLLDLMAAALFLSCLFFGWIYLTYGKFDESDDATLTLCKIFKGFYTMKYSDNPSMMMVVFSLVTKAIPLVFFASIGIGLFYKLQYLASFGFQILFGLTFNFTAALPAVSISTLAFAIQALSFSLWMMDVLYSVVIRILLWIIDKIIDRRG